MYVLSTATYEQRNKLAEFCACYGGLSDDAKRALDVMLVEELGASPTRFHRAMDALCTCCGSWSGGGGGGGGGGGSPKPDPNPNPNPNPKPEDPGVISEPTKKCIGDALSKICDLGTDTLDAIHKAASVAANLIDDPTVKTAAFAVLAMLARIISYCKGAQGLSLTDLKGLCAGASSVGVLQQNGVVMAALSVGNVASALQSLIACCNDPAIQSAPLPAWYPKPTITK